MQYRFRTLFALLLAMLLVYPALHGPGGSVFLADLLLTAMFFGAMWVLLSEKHWRPVKLLCGLPAVVGAWIGDPAPGSPQLAAAAFFHGAALVLLLVLLFVVLKTVYRETHIHTDSVFASLCGYIILGVCFGHAYSLLEAIRPGSFKLDAAVAGGELHLELAYFSFVTLTTVGYGDVLAASRTARSLAMVEALLGQCYIAVLVADLIGKRLARSGPEA